MKIAVFFIIVGISSCFVDAQYGLDCSLKMDHAQAYSMGCEVVALLIHYHRIRDSGDECEIKCCWKKVFYTMDLMAAATGCPYEAMAWIVVTCLPPDWQSQRMTIKDALVRRDHEKLHNMKFPLNVMVSTCICSLNTLLKKRGHNSRDILLQVVVSLASTTPGILNVVNSLKASGIILDVVPKVTDGVTTLVTGLGTVVVGAGRNPVLNGLLGGILQNALGTSLNLIQSLLGILPGGGGGSLLSAAG